MRPDNYSNPYDWGAYGADPPIAAAPIPLALNISEAYEAVTTLKAPPTVQAIVDGGIILIGAGVGWNLDDKISRTLGYSSDDLNPLAAAAAGIMVANGVGGFVSGWLANDLREGFSSLATNSFLAILPLYFGTSDVKGIEHYHSKAMIGIGATLLGSMLLLKGLKVSKV